VIIHTFFNFSRVCILLLILYTHVVWAPVVWGPAPPMALPAAPAPFVLGHVVLYWLFGSNVFVPIAVGTLFIGGVGYAMRCTNEQTLRQVHAKQHELYALVATMQTLIQATTMNIKNEDIEREAYSNDAENERLKRNLALLGATLGQAVIQQARKMQD
jgi:hypothetical protein